ncbi:MAG: hypothetical protein WCN95_07485 [bacterium]
MRRWETRTDGEVRRVGLHGQWYACAGRPLAGASPVGVNAGRREYVLKGSKTRSFVRSSEIIAMLVMMCRRKFN